MDAHATPGRHRYVVHTPLALHCAAMLDVAPPLALAYKLQRR